VFLIQILLPASAAPAHERGGIARTRAELVERFGGVTAYTQTPAEGEWRATDGHVTEDRVALVEVVAPAFDREWWKRYATTLARRFSEEAVHIRALPMELLDPESA
jgi:hypothetical protein